MIRRSFLFLPFLAFPALAQTQPEQIVAATKAQLGSRDWAFVKAKGVYPVNTNKCNLFVDDMLRPLGFAPPFVERGMIYSLRDKVMGTNRATHPVLAAGWASKTAQIQGWQVVQTPQAGDVAAYAFDYGNASGHVGIVSFVKGDDIRIISFLPATQTVIETNVKDFNAGENHALTFRRFMR